MLATEDVLEEMALEATANTALETWVEETATEVSVMVLVRLRVVVVVPLEVSSAATKEAPAARTVNRMFEICILKIVCCVIWGIPQSVREVVVSETTNPKSVCAWFYLQDRNIGYHVYPNTMEQFRRLDKARAGGEMR